MSDIENRIDKIQEELTELKGLMTNDKVSPQVQADTPAAARRSRGDLYTAIGAVVISVIVMISFGVMLYVTATLEFPASQKDNVSGLLWTLNTLAVAVVSYWVGSSAGSLRKTYMMENMNTKRRGRCEE